MSQWNRRKLIAPTGLLSVVVLTSALLARPACAATPGIGTTSPVNVTFNLSAEEAFTSQPDGQMIYSWGYGCLTGAVNPGDPTFPGAVCPSMQVPGPTLIVVQGVTVTVNLTNNLPAAAGNTSILFPGFDVTTSGGVAGLLTQEAQHLNTVTYSFTASSPGTRTYYSGTQGDLQIEMGLSGAIVVLPKNPATGCRALGNADPWGHDYRLAVSAFSNSATCYDREYLFQFAEIDPVIHRQAELQRSKSCTRVCTGGTNPGTVCTADPGACLDGGVCSSSDAGCMNVRTENYHPAYFMINGRSMPDDMDPNYAVQYPHQPYNGNPHMHPGELTLLRITGQGRWQHPFHEHGNHVRVLARDGNLITTSDDKLAGPLLFTTTTTPGQAMDGIFYWTGKGLNWDVYGHKPGDLSDCFPDANGYYTRLRSTPTVPDSASLEPNYYEWCGDHNKPLEANPAGDVGSGGPVTLPDPNILAAGPWYGGSAYLGPDATARAAGLTPIAPSGTVANSPSDEAGFAYMWHSHNEREITTNNAFPGGMLMMMLVDPYSFAINESK